MTIGNNTNIKCVKCGTPLNEEQVFCPKCGTAKVIEKQNICSQCGTELQTGQIFCPKCGKKAEETVNVPMHNTQKKALSKGIIAVLVAVAVILSALVLPNLLVSVEDLCEQGNYIGAYKKASGSEKDKVLAENVIAVLSEESSDVLKNPDSFVLQQGYYYGFISDDGDFQQQATLYLSGTNGFGGIVSHYFAWVYSNDSQEWEYWGSVDNYTLQEDDEIEDALVKVVAKVGVEDGIKLDKSQVQNINNQFKADTLDTVELIAVDDIDTKRFPEE